MRSPVGRNVQGLDRVFGSAVNQHRPARELRHLADHGARAGGMKSAATAISVWPSESDMAGQNYIEPMTGFADFEQRLPGAVAANLAESAHPL